MPDEERNEEEVESSQNGSQDERFEEGVTKSELRKESARRRGDSLLSWLGTFGLVGWSITLPMLAAIALGIWLDERFDGPFSWTLAMLLAGLVVGCALAWYWIRRESSQ